MDALIQIVCTVLCWQLIPFDRFFFYIYTRVCTVLVVIFIFINSNLTHKLSNEKVSGMGYFKRKENIALLFDEKILHILFTLNFLFSILYSFSVWKQTLFWRFCENFVGKFFVKKKLLAGCERLYWDVFIVNLVHMFFIKF